MSDASERLQRSRMAIVEHIHRRERRHDPRVEIPDDGSPGESSYRQQPAASREAGLFGRLEHAAQTWWRHHPAHMALEVTAPFMRAYARRRPGQLVGFAALAGVALMLARPWRLISLTTLVVALLKASHLPSVVMSAMAAADYERDQERPE